jgi:mRNA interferase RelE/StbE
MTYEVRLSRRAATYLRRLDERTRHRIVQRLDQIAGDPYGPHSKALTNVAGLRSARVGDYRIVFGVADDDRIVSVSAIGPRGAVYRDL